MAGASSVLLDDTRLSKADQYLYKLESFFALLSGLAAFSLMILAVISVGGRNMFATPMPGYVDFIELLMPLIAVMGVAYVQRDGGHIRMDILISHLRGRAQWMAEILTVIAMIVVMILLVWGSWAHFDRSFDFGQPLWSTDSSLDINLPIWPAKLLVPVAFAVLCIRLFVQLFAYSRAFYFNLDTPVAVPMIEDAATQAAREAEHVSGSPTRKE